MFLLGFLMFILHALRVPSGLSKEDRGIRAVSAPTAYQDHVWFQNPEARYSLTVAF